MISRKTLMFVILMVGIGGTAVHLSQTTAFAQRPAPASPLPLSANDDHFIFLPAVFRNFTPPFFDDFSDPASGWYIGEDDFVRSEYLNGEYRILTKQSEYTYIYKAPDEARQNYRVSVDARWETDSGNDYALILGLDETLDEYILFSISSDYQDFSLFKWVGSYWEEYVLFQPANAIQTGGAVNHLEAAYVDGFVSLSVNGADLGDWFVGTAGGPTWTGVAVTPYENAATADGRFDNYFVETVSPSTGSYGPSPAPTAVSSISPERTGFHTRLSVRPPAARLASPAP